MKTLVRRTLGLLALLCIPACGSSNSTNSQDPITGVLGLLSQIHPAKAGLANEGSLSGIVLGDAVTVSWSNTTNGASGMADLSWVQDTAVVDGTVVPVWNHVWSASSIPLSPGRNEIVITTTGSSGTQAIARNR